MTRPLRFSEIQDAVADAPTILIATDFDGTICSLADRPDGVHTPSRAVATLERLAARAGVILSVLSGRSLADLRSRLDVNAIYAGNHGLEINGRGFDFVHPEGERLAPKLRNICEAVREAVSAWPGAWVEDKRLTATVHMRECPTDQWMAIRDAIRTVVRPVDDVFFLRNGRAAFEIAPRTGWDKGSAVRYIERELQLEEALIFCIGDDETDETMFRALPDGITIRVAPNGDSEAQYSLENSAAVLDLFERITETVAGPPKRIFGAGFRLRPAVT
jgi:trehalose 6-phosphate phosphatase